MNNNDFFLSAIEDCQLLSDSSDYSLEVQHLLNVVCKS